MKRQAMGHRGSWFASVDGESLPCVHSYWMQKEGTETWYNDPNVDSNDSKYISSIEKRPRVILTKSRVVDEKQPFNRTDYVAVFEIDSFSLDGTNLRFRFGNRVGELR